MTVTVACIRMITKIERLKKTLMECRSERVGIYRLTVDCRTDFLVHVGSNSIKCTYNLFYIV